MAKMTEKQLETLNRIRKQAQDTLMLCKDAQEGRISGEEFEKRVSKVGGRVLPHMFGGGLSRAR